MLMFAVEHSVKQEDRAMGFIPCVAHEQQHMINSILGLDSIRRLRKLQQGLSS